MKTLSSSLDCEQLISSLDPLLSARMKLQSACVRETLLTLITEADTCASEVFFFVCDLLREHKSVVSWAMWSKICYFLVILIACGQKIDYEIEETDLECTFHSTKKPSSGWAYMLNWTRYNEILHINWDDLNYNPTMLPLQSLMQCDHDQLINTRHTDQNSQQDAVEDIVPQRRHNIFRLQQKAALHPKATWLALRQPADDFDHQNGTETFGVSWL